MWWRPGCGASGPAPRVVPGQVIGSLVWDLTLSIAGSWWTVEHGEHPQASDQETVS